jgi:hypothetical protein
MAILGNQKYPAPKAPGMDKNVPLNQASGIITAAHIAEATK